MTILDHDRHQADDRQRADPGLGDVARNRSRPQRMRMKQRMGGRACGATDKGDDVQAVVPRRIARPCRVAMTSWRHRGAASSLGSGRRSRPQMRSSRAWCSTRTPVSSTPSLRNSHRNRAPGVSRLPRPPISRVHGVRALRVCSRRTFRTCLACVSVWIPSEPASRNWEPSPLKTSSVGGVAGETGFTARRGSRARAWSRQESAAQSGGAVVENHVRRYRVHRSSRPGAIQIDFQAGLYGRPGAAISSGCYVRTST